MRDVPVDISKILPGYAKKHIAKGGCCGASELIKLHAYTLEEYHRVVHVDLDWIMLQPFEELFELEYSLLHTDDINMKGKNSPISPVQGGFLLVKPSMEVFRDIVNIIYDGDYRPGSGWGGRVGWFYGGLTIQGEKDSPQIAGFVERQ